MGFRLYRCDECEREFASKLARSGHLASHAKARKAAAAKLHPFNPEASAVFLPCGHPPRSGYCVAACAAAERGE